MRVTIVAVVLSAACASAIPRPSPDPATVRATAACNGTQHFAGALVAAYATTAGAIAQWQETRNLPNGPRIVSRWRSHDATEPVTLCYFDGAFPCPGGPPPLPPATPRPMYDRLVLEVGNDGEAVMDTCTYQTITAASPH